MSAVVAVAGAEALAGLRRVWLAALALAGIATLVGVSIWAASESGAARDDAFRAGSAGLLLLGGLVVALLLGSGMVNRDADGGWYGLLVGAGGGREAVTAGRLAGRALLLIGVVALWGVAMQLGSVIVGRGLDGALAVHTSAMVENLLLVFLAASLASVALGPVASGVVGVVTLIIAQAFTNLHAAADAGVIGSVASPLVKAGYVVLPRAIMSPMISGMQVRGAAGPAAPRFEINDAIVYIPPAGALTILWTLLWCGILAGGTIAAMRRRALS